jgi:hypothetical protein
MENTSISVPLPPDLLKEAGALEYLGKGAKILRGALVGHSDDALRAMGKLTDVRKYVSRSGFSVPSWNKAINIGTELIPKAMPGKSFLSGGITEAVKTPGHFLDNKFNPLGWYTGGSGGWNTLKSRFAQGGVFGKGGVAHGTMAVNPRLGYNFKDMISGNRLLPSYKGGKFDFGSVLGTAGRGTAEAGKWGMGVGMPAAAVYGAFNPQEGDERGLGQRLGGALGSAVGTYASFPLGALSYLPSTVAPFVTSNKTVQRAAEAITPWAIGQYAGEVAGSLGNRRAYNPEEYQKKKYEQQLLRSSQLQQQYRGSMSVAPPRVPYGMTPEQYANMRYQSLRGPYGTRQVIMRTRRTQPPIPPGLNSRR